MLVLDEKKIRKGRPVGLPYVGSKKKISKKIVEIIKQNFGTDKTVYDLFGGGGAITAELLINNMNVVYNELDKTVVDMFCAVLVEDREWLKTLMISRDEFMAIREKENKSVDDELKLLVNSFGNDRKSYLYNKNISDLKYNLAKKIIDKHNVFSGYKQTDTYKDAVKQTTQLQQLERLQQLQQLQQLQVTSNDYREYSYLKDSIIYLDPPYENATGYVDVTARKTSAEKYNKIREYLLNNPEVENIVIDKIEYKIGKNKNNKNRMYEKDLFGVFNSREFYDWAFEMSKNNIVLISSYEISDPRFEVVYEFKTARSTLQGGFGGKRYEKLFMIRN